MSLPYRLYTITCIALKALGISEEKRTLSYRKNVMVKFNQNGELYTKMGVCVTSAGVSSGHIKGRLIDKIRPLPLKICTCLTDHNKSVTSLTDEEIHIVTPMNYDAFCRTIHQTGSLANNNPPYLPDANVLSRVKNSLHKPWISTCRTRTKRQNDYNLIH